MEPLLPRSAPDLEDLAREVVGRSAGLDGRGNLSNEALVAFCRFFLAVSLDQISFMGDLLRLDTLLDRISGYVSLRGKVSRGDMLRVSGLAERTGRTVLGQLLDEKLLVSDTPKGNVRLNFPTHLAGHLFPDLYPAWIG